MLLKQLDSCSNNNPFLLDWSARLSDALALHAFSYKWLVMLTSKKESVLMREGAKSLPLHQKAVKSLQVVSVVAQYINYASIE